MIDCLIVALKCLEYKLPGKHITNMLSSVAWTNTKHGPPPMLMNRQLNLLIIEHATSDKQAANYLAGLVAQSTCGTTKEKTWSEKMRPGSEEIVACF